MKVKDSLQASLKLSLQRAVQDMKMKQSLQASLKTQLSNSLARYENEGFARRQTPDARRQTPDADARHKLAPRSNLAVLESIWLKQGRKVVGLIPEVAWPLMDPPGAGTFNCSEMAAGGAQLIPEVARPLMDSTGSVSD